MYSFALVFKATVLDGYGNDFILQFLEIFSLSLVLPRLYLRVAHPRLTIVTVWAVKFSENIPNEVNKTLEFITLRFMVITLSCCIQLPKGLWDYRYNTRHSENFFIPSHHYTTTRNMVTGAVFLSQKRGVNNTRNEITFLIEQNLWAIVIIIVCTLCFYKVQ